MSISLVIPTIRIGDVLDKAIKSMEGQYDELIVVDFPWDNLGKKINYGLKKSTGDYVIVSNDDVEVDKGRLEDLCDYASVVSPLVNGCMCKAFHAHMECFPRWVLEEGVCWPEDYDGWYYDDSDVWMQLIKHGVGIRQDIGVNIKHEHPSTTIRTFDNTKRLETNRDIFIKRWGEESLKLVGCV